MLKKISEQIDALLSEVARAKAASPHDDLSGGLSDDELMKIRTRLMACIKRLAPEGSSYLQDAQAVKGWNGYMVVELAGIASALKEDYEAGYMSTVEELVHGTIFEDFLEMSSELHKKGYKDAAAVIAGSVLEEHTRKLAGLSGIDILASNGKPKKFDLLTSELVKAQQFGEPQRKIIVGWYGQRSEAAHGRYENVISEEVARMIDGIRDFIARLPA